MNNRVQLSVSGRLCLFGEHSDWAASHGVHPGFCISIGTDQHLKATARASDSFLIETVIPDKMGLSSSRLKRMSCLWEAGHLRSAAEDKSEFFRYCAGVAYEALTKYGVSSGIEVHITEMDLPLKKGVSSSAAVCVLIAEALNFIWDLNLSYSDLMDMAYNGERLTGSQCGRLDQSCIYGKTPVLLSFDKSDTVDVKPISCSGEIHMFFVDLAGQKDTVRILKDLQTSYPANKGLKKALGTENEKIISLAREALNAGDARTLGYLMNQAQKVFDELVAPCCPEELKSPLLHELLYYEPLRDYVYGGKGVGSQGDGTAQFVARNESARKAAMRLVESDFPEMRCYPLTIPNNTIKRADVISSQKRKIGPTVQSRDCVSIKDKDKINSTLP
ncbi:MAG: hypothetical protein JW715_13265 [Sedimentisphaerales bacterium]|nr:hypothetical protein [Sedimentisphaerales bacterium]